MSRPPPREDANAEYYKTVGQGPELFGVVGEQVGLSTFPKVTRARFRV